MENDKTTQDVLKLEQLLMRLKESFRASDDFNYNARADSFRKLEDNPLWVAIILSVKPNLASLFGAKNMTHTLSVHAYMDDGTDLELLLVMFDTREEAVLYGSTVSKILDKVSNS